MSESGIQKFSAVLSVMQEVRGKLLRGDKQDIRLGQMLDDMKKLILGRFILETFVTRREQEK